MSAYDAKDKLIDTAIDIQRIAKKYTVAEREFEEAIYYLCENQARCHEMGVHWCMTCETSLERALNTARSCYALASELDQLSCEFVQAMETCGFLMEPDFPDELRKLKL